jgi:hypothetical protein
MIFKKASDLNPGDIVPKGKVKEVVASSSAVHITYTNGQKDVVKRNKTFKVNG